MAAHSPIALLAVAGLLIAWLAGSPVHAQDENRPLQLHPQNARYFEYNGLPMVLFGHQGGLRNVPVPADVEPEDMAAVAQHANHFYMAVHPTWVRATYEEVHETLNDDRHWQHVRQIIEAAHEQDVIVHLFFWSYKFNFAEQAFSGSDMLWPDPSHDGREVLEGVTRRDLHRLAIEKVVEHTWDMPNVVYNFMWEYNVRRHGGEDPDGDFHRWWADELRAAGERVDPGIEHLISIKWGRHHPSENNADFIVEEDGNGFFYGHPRRVPLSFGVPCVFISSDFVFADNDFTGWDEVPWNPRVWGNGQVGEYHLTPRDLRAMVVEGFHPAETWMTAQEGTLRYYLQLRWYQENLPTWPEEPGRGVSEERVPEFVPSERPRLANPDGYTNGRAGSDYGVIYRHPQGLPPAQAEVWVDLNGDGRFDPDPAAGERISMEAEGDDFEAGVRFRATGSDTGRYVFRFADQNWNPPETGGLQSGKAAGITYRSLE